MNLEVLRAGIDRVAAEAGFSGAVRVDVDGGSLHLAYGAADRASGRPNTVTTRFAVASGSKAFTALMIVRRWHPCESRNPVARGISVEYRLSPG